ncbi:MAG: 5'-nucleotidase C-terminal domain-containing protein [Prolixibacteraceae bacterium]|jgi:2',3'-cyclic-nucleotide 2'-phosphodiesterase (5'-nucleotidase family)|nr:5'-nucleotidase C-terminal domain-containing protein [Prolixibacteraceae bacterium]MBT6005643.1 5'-nucleotidase C-terminal domain-containing protein [Prolixibacteraceae bacterium]MBT6763586.1 5'-nucleotidase C-terminal domain-containing protein [Prolixibacteraceae bacterium]MBT6999310.1 5'-nucleotidase C-terminal domain-containing protein [Prolixibacteraceae bacterium]MBT7393206.1 5'-nucleotidase C-terminal domain-containing protein [Prolixibacteraceae bacterium]
MRRSITHTLLITCALLLFSCKTQYLPATIESQNISVSESLNDLDHQLVQLYLPFKNILDKDMDRVISVSEMEMQKGRPESFLTNFLGDLLLQEGKKEFVKLGLEKEPAISYFNYGGIRSFLPKGEITVGKIFELMPFENEMVFLQLTGNQIQEFLNIIAEKGGGCVAGARFNISNKKAENILIKGDILKSNSKYWLVTNDYVADGGDGFEVFTKRVEFANSRIKIRDVIISYLEDKQEKGEVITAKLDGRIVNE